MGEFQEWPGVAVVGVLSLFFLREVLGFLKTRAGVPGFVEQAKAAAELQAELRKLSDAITSLSTILSTLTAEVRDVKSQVRELREDVNELKRRIK